jgi:hypothetical protein
MYSARWVSIDVHVGMRYDTRGLGDAELWLQSEGERAAPWPEIGEDE